MEVFYNEMSIVSCVMKSSIKNWTLSFTLIVLTDECKDKKKNHILMIQNIRVNKQG